MRQATITRKTRETDIVIKLNIDGTGNYLDKDGNSFSTILEYINHRMELQKGIDETNNVTTRK